MLSGCSRPGYYVRVAMSVIVALSFVFSAANFELRMYANDNFKDAPCYLFPNGDHAAKRFLPSPLDDDDGVLFQEDALRRLAFHWQSGDNETFPSTVFPHSVKVLHHKDWDCPEYRTWDTVRSIGGKMNEMLQEKGFVKFFMEGHFPRVEHWSLVNISQTMLDNQMAAPKGSLVFLPVCCYSNSSIGVEGDFHERTDTLPGKGQSGVSFETMVKPGGQHFFINHQVFWVIPHPNMIPHHWSEIRNSRSLRIDETVQFARGDVIIPVSVEEKHCPLELPEDIGSFRERLLFGCGRDRRKRYAGWRARLFEQVQALNRSDVFAATSMSLDQYNDGFFKSKFCFVVPGDTIGTSQATRTLCGGCVPIFVIEDARLLPFGSLLNYSSFSLQRSPLDLIRRNGVPYLIAELRALVESGGYDKLHKHGRMARDFFNYHRFDERSPYAAALLSIVLDERQNN